MTATRDEILADRRVRSAELALDAARRRLADTQEELTRLRERVVLLETTLLERDAFQDPEPDRLRAELARRSATLLEAEQALHIERQRRLSLQDELSTARRDPAPAVQGVERELAVAQRRAAALEAELTLVRRHAAEFEHTIRLAANEVWAWLEELSERFSQALVELEEIRRHQDDADDAQASAPASTAVVTTAAPVPAAEPEQPPAPEREALAPEREALAPEREAHAPEREAHAPEREAPMTPGRTDDEVEPARLDRALERLRAQASDEAERAPKPSARRPAKPYAAKPRRWFFRR